MGAIKWIIDKLDGWKTIIAYMLAQIPYLADKPWLIEAIQKVIAAPDDPNAWGELIVQVLFAIGVLHRIAKNIKK